MARDDHGREMPARRDVVRGGSALLGGGLLAGCLSGGDGTATDQTTAENTATETGADDQSYSVTMDPVGTVEFEEPPETWLAFLSTYGDMGIALGQIEGLRGLWDPEDVPTAFYDYLPGVDVSMDDVAAVAGESGFDKEVFYELDCDVHLVDPNWLGVLSDDWNGEDADEIGDAVGPFLGNYLRRRGDDWHDYPYYSLYEAFEKVAEAFRERERFEAFQSIHDDVLAEVESSLPAPEERPRVGLLSVNSDFEGGSFYAYPVQDGNNHKQYRDLGMRDAFAEHIQGNYANWDYEALLEVDPDAIVFQYGFSHVTESEFDDLMDALRDDPVGGRLSAVQNDRLYRGGASYQGPVVNLFQTEAAAKQFYPETFGEWRGMETFADDEEALFDRQAVADIINGDF
ncbi:ABC transporter substrate-binding protein (plasmid) [Halobacterium sp. NMX12-1]|uniref:ABC transporter substrate-binding protein n=1 Tax=Halobacterium sp. NMX12-1 TaxID=3166650 RepID=A0AAU8C8G3_9EURY